ncbi:MAG TPA: LacI family DNA-binding transcriptional regulator [Microlunatus sp.]
MTLKDVAHHSGVSKALASIVMRDAPGASAATRERVLAAARQLGYRPDLRAQSLAGQKSRIIGIMFGVGLGTFHFDLLEGLYSAARGHGHHLVLSPVTKGRDEAEAAESLRDFRFDGLIMLGPATATPLLAGEVPMVVVGWQVDHPAVDVVRTSDDIGMALAVDHLVELGHCRIAHIDGGDNLIAAARRRAFVLAMRRRGLGSQARVVPGGQTQIDGQRAARRIVGERNLPTAVVAFNDDIAVAAMGLFAQTRVDIPARLSVIGWDDSEAAALSPVGLTSVAQRPELLAQTAVDRVVARIEQRRVEGREIVLQPELRLRQSTAVSFDRMS